MKIISYGICLLALLASSAHAVIAAPPDRSPEDTIREFYRWYVKALVAEANPLDQKAKMKQFATARLRNEIERLSTVDSDMDGGGLSYDPIILGQDFDKDWATNITVREVKVKGDSAEATVELRGREIAYHKLNIALLREDGAWKVDKIDSAD